MTRPVSIQVELFGIPRRRAGVSAIELALVLPAGQSSATLADVLAGLAKQSPPLAAECFPQGVLLPSYVLNLAGQRFLRDPHTQIAAGAVLLLLSTDAGG